MPDSQVTQYTHLKPTAMGIFISMYYWHVEGKPTIIGKLVRQQLLNSD